MRRLTAILLLSCIATVAYPVTASAHVLRTDGAISAELHIEPYDHPLSGEPTTYLLSFEDEPAGFSLSGCNCNVTIIEHSKTISSGALAPTKTVESKNVFTFPKADDYTVRVSGQPKQPGQFQSFRVEYPVTVAEGKAAKHSVSPFVLGVASTGIVVIIATAFFMERSGRKSNKPTA